jgi:hypothetical protein
MGLNCFAYAPFSVLLHAMNYQRKTDAPEGKRTGPKRKHVDGTVRLASYVDPETAAKIDRIATEKGISKSDASAMAIRNGIKTL